MDKDVERNRDHILRQMTAARKRGAAVAHFSESALSGYPGVEFQSFRGFDWDLLTDCTQQVLNRARKLSLWVILGTSHRLSGNHKPHNSVYVINDRGRIIDRYDKMFCTGNRARTGGDLKHFSPGNHFAVFSIKGVQCGTQICHDFRYDELCRQYKRRGVQVMFYSFHNGHTTRSKVKQYRHIHPIGVPVTMQAYAANNYMWISANNTSARESQWPSFFVRPDGNFTGRLRLHHTSILVSKIDTKAKLYDASATWRDRALSGIYHSGTLVRDRRSTCRTAY